MGVLGLWEILHDVQSLKTKNDLVGKTLAIDLALWICEAESVKPMKNAIRKPYLRNLFFRVTSLLRSGIQPIFIIDGKAPELKWETMAKRMNARNNLTSVRSCASGSRSRLNTRFNECCKLLEHLGIPWIKSPGEAEATCAALNLNNIVDACVTNDGDCFLYGARTVYRNLNVDSRGISAECYEMKDIESKLSLNRSSLIALGLILGCDYSPQGVPGVGRIHAIELLAKFKDKNCIEELKLWKSKEIINISAKKPTHCSTCKHEGTKSNHVKYGCSVCGNKCKDGVSTGVKCNCNWHEDEPERKAKSHEEGVRTKINKVDDFPNQKIVNEFLKVINVEKFKALHFKKPCLELAVGFLTDQLDWPQPYAIKKTIPLLTYWVLHNEIDRNGELQLIRVIKSRVSDGIPMYELEWSCDLFDEMDNTTIEPQHQVTVAYPKIVEEFVNKIENEKKAKKTSKKKKTVSKVAVAENNKLTNFFKIKKKKDLDLIEKPNQVVKDGEDLDVIFISESKISDVNNNINLGHQASPKRPAGRFLKLTGKKYTAALISALNSVKISCENKENCLTPSTQRVDNFQSDAKDISFNLDFSLGDSLLRTPMAKIENKSNIENKDRAKIPSYCGIEICDFSVNDTAEDLFGECLTPNSSCSPLKFDSKSLPNETESIQTGIFPKTKSSPINIKTSLKSNKSHDSDHEIAFGHVNQNDSMTSEEDGSPVYISLMERLKL